MIEGMSSVFRQWTALELAIFHQWGGPKPEEIITEMKDELMGMFTGPERIYKDDVSFVLEDYMESNFNTVCDDGSADELGELFVDMWRKCCAGEFAMVQDILEKERKRASVTGQCTGLEGGDAIDDDDDEDVSDGMALNDMVKERALEALAEEVDGEGGEKMDADDDGEEAPPLVDADGFTTVATGKKKKKNKKP
jgi:pre-rRNA-processing protein TSR2